MPVFSAIHPRFAVVGFVFASICDGVVSICCFVAIVGYEWFDCWFVESFFLESPDVLFCQPNRGNGIAVAEN